MTRELVIHANSNGVEIALLEEKKLVEYHIESKEDEGYDAGDIYIGRIKKLNPALNAAFVDIGYGKDAFIHYSDLSPNVRTLIKIATSSINGNKISSLETVVLEPPIDKNGNISDVLKKGDIGIFQIAKEAISTKGPRLTCEISIPGRFVVLSPFASGVGISKKITDEAERERLLNISKQLKPNNVGLVIRTNAEKVSEKDLKADIDHIYKKWTTVIQKTYKAKLNKLLLKEMAKSQSIIRDLVNDSFEQIITDDKELYGELKSFLHNRTIDKAKLLKLYNDHTPIFEAYEVSKQIKTAFGKIVTLKSGAYIIIEHTEAMHVIDVNSGPKVKKDVDQDTNAYNINLLAANEIARQLRLRNIGGIIVVDFIDMKSKQYKDKIFEAMQKAMKPDKAKHILLPISKFGLMEITRQRVKEEVSVDIADTKILKSIEEPLQIVENIENELLFLRSSKTKNFLLYVHPFIYAYLRKGTLSFRMKWYTKTNKWIKLIQDSSLKLSEYKLIEQD
ncbi:MAG: Rne/Rng family ribonuclease [Chitinophagales bacterium]|nr:Rne/Rng family ribonuclease [Chitinophagales bacterium]